MVFIYKILRFVASVLSGTRFSVRLFENVFTGSVSMTPLPWSAGRAPGAVGVGLGLLLRGSLAAECLFIHLFSLGASHGGVLSIKIELGKVLWCHSSEPPSTVSQRLHLLV